MEGTVNFAEMREKLYSAVIVDVLDTLGYRNQAMRGDIRPLDQRDIVVGRAFTVLATDVYEIPAHPYKMELEACDHLKKDDVLVATTNGSTASGFWGELLSTVCMVRGANGAIIDGPTRDTRKIRSMDFTVFARGMNPLDSKGRTDVIAYDVPILCGGVQVKTGDIIFGDYDGIAVIPQEVEEEALKMAFEKVSAENVVRDEVLRGVSATEVYEKYHIL
ncbi:RraA family protein [uncultured Oscillibacter sp.]|uniref:RraA family protein n=1 Tax=uncultured Oscillibacter sp. TaxID=876091 RepID=UPI0025EBDEAF|nr:RraA family protein [uncultured Oscillibacter sp.]